MTVTPPRVCIRCDEMLAAFRLGMISTLAGPVRRQNGYTLFMRSKSSATSAFISPSNSKSTCFFSSTSTASRTTWVFSGRGLPKLANDSRATRGSCPMRRAVAAAWTAMSAIWSGPGIRCTAVSARNTVRPRLTSMVMPKMWASSPGSRTRVISSNAVW